MHAIHLLTLALLVPPAVNAQADREWATYYGDTGNELGTGCAVDTEGNVYLGGSTASPAGIASGGYQMTYAGGAFDAFLAKFDDTGARLWATYYGGADLDAVTSVAVDGTDVYIAGQTISATGIAFNAHQDTFAGAMDLFLAKFNGAGQLQWATYYGGIGQEQEGPMHRGPPMATCTYRAPRSRPPHRPSPTAGIRTHTEAACTRPFS